MVDLMVTQAKVADSKPDQVAPVAAGGGVPRPAVKYVTGAILRSAIVDSFRKLDPRVQVRNPVMFVVFIGSIFTTIIGVGATAGLIEGAGRPGFILTIAAWLWLTVLFANFAEALAEGRG